MTQLILASASPRRRQLIQLLPYPATAITADVDESQITHPNLAINVTQRAALKAKAIAQTAPLDTTQHYIIIGSDTTVALDNQMLGKPANIEAARNMLTRLRGRTHHVHTGHYIIDTATGQHLEAVHTAAVTMRPYSNAEIEAYLATGDPFDKAGAYAIQHQGFHPVQQLEGCFTGVMGLSVCQLLQCLQQLDSPLTPMRTIDQTAVWQAHQQYACPLFNKYFRTST